MGTYISILRGINVGGKNKIPMAELKALYEELKFKNITTYIQSGNVVFSTPNDNQQVVSKKIEEGVLKRFGFNVPVIMRTTTEMQSVIKTNPFIKNKGTDETKLHITFLAGNPAADNLKKVMEYNYEPDEFTVIGKEVYLFCPGGYGNTKLSNNFFESKLKVGATTRNWKTVNELLKIALAVK